MSETLSRIEASALAALRRQAAEVYPEECCGILLGAGEDTVSEAVAAANVAAGDRRRRYDIDPRTLLRVHRESREQGRRVVGYYHSHPHEPAVPSGHDSELAWPGVCYLIVAVDEGGAGEIRCWRRRFEADGWDELTWSTITR